VQPSARRLSVVAAGARLCGGATLGVVPCTPAPAKAPESASSSAPRRCGLVPFPVLSPRRRTPARRSPTGSTMWWSMIRGAGRRHRASFGRPGDSHRARIAGVCINQGTQRGIRTGFSGGASTSHPSSLPRGPLEMIPRDRG